jgi:hypothetical protein
MFDAIGSRPSFSHEIVNFEDPRNPGKMKKSIRSRTQMNTRIAPPSRVLFKADLRFAGTLQAGLKSSTMEVYGCYLRCFPERVGAENPVTSSDVQILVYEAAEPISS